MQRRAHRQPSGRLLGQAGHIHLAPLRQQQRARDRRRGHHQHVGLLALAAQQQPLVHPEPVLLVDHRQRQVAIFHAVLEQRVRADHHRTSPSFSPRSSADRAAALHAAGQHRHRLGRQPRQRAVMLLGQHLGRRHQRRLPAGLHRAQHRQQRHQRLARADIALQQPQHAPVGAEVGVDLRQRLRLRSRSACSRNAPAPWRAACRRRSAPGPAAAATGRGSAPAPPGRPATRRRPGAPAGARPALRTGACTARSASAKAGHFSRRSSAASCHSGSAGSASQCLCHRAGHLAWPQPAGQRPHRLDRRQQIRPVGRHHVLGVRHGAAGR